jgi:hypothetical protein
MNDIIPELFIEGKNQSMDCDIAELLARELAELSGS